MSASGEESLVAGSALSQPIATLGYIYTVYLGACGIFMTSSRGLADALSADNDSICLLALSVPSMYYLLA